MTLESCATLPSYSPSLPAPTYSFEPTCGEQRLQHTPSSSTSRPTPTSSYIKKSGKATVVLNEQEDGVEMPSYGRHALISGALCLDESLSETVIEVVIKVEGKLDTTVSEGGGKTTSLVKDCYTLWSRKNSPGPTCPSQIPFAFVLPSTFRDGDTDRSLPASYYIFSVGIPSLFLKTTYNLRVVITRLGHQKLGFWTKTKQIFVPFSYCPRTRAHRPIVPNPCFFSAIKTSPEEWYQAMSQIKTRSTSSLEPLTCHLFIPAGRVFGISDVIPYHLQLSGRVSTLRELFSSPLGRVTSADSQKTAKSSIVQENKATIRVYLMRQVTVEVRGQKAWRNIQLGEGSLSPTPPLLHDCYSSPTDWREGHLDWEGELRCREDVTVGGFTAANVQLKEFVMLSITPPTPARSPLLELQLSVPIRIVTDSWGDTTGLDTAT